MTISGWRLELGLAGLLALAMLGCSEKSSGGGKSTGGADGVAASGDDGLDDDDDSGDDDGEPGTPITFDLCKDGLKKASLTGFDSYIETMCSGDKPKVAALRGSDVVYKGGDAKIYKDDPKKGKTETSIRIYTSTLVDAKVKDYWALMQLQLKKTEAYRTNYDYDTSASLSEIKPEASKVSFRYAYDSGNGGGADYTATTKFVVLSEGKAYMSATKLDKTYETMKALTGLIIINKVSSTKTEVFTMSDQTYSHQENQGDAAEDQAISTAEQEQVRMFKNGKKANKAPGLLSE